jgi:RNA polymerase sigma-B factor
VHQFERLAYSIANRYARHSPEDEDLFQVARIGLVKAVDRFDPTTCFRFTTFATPTILGEIKRHFRDHSRSVHVPRGIQELASKAERANRELTRRLGRAPVIAELAAELGVSEERVLEAQSMEENCRPLSLDVDADASDSGERAGDLTATLGSEDAGLASAEHRVGLGQALSHLSTQLRAVIQLRYIADLSQREVARRLNLSQMQVCRMEKRALRELRTHFAVN